MRQIQGVMWLTGDDIVSTSTIGVRCCRRQTAKYPAWVSLPHPIVHSNATVSSTVLATIAIVATGLRYSMALKINDYVQNSNRSNAEQISVYKCFMTSAPCSRCPNIRRSTAINTVGRLAMTIQHIVQFCWTMTVFHDDVSRVCRFFVACISCKYVTLADRLLCSDVVLANGVWFTLARTIITWLTSLSSFRDVSETSDDTYANSMYLLTILLYAQSSFVAIILLLVVH